MADKDHMKIEWPWDHPQAKKAEEALVIRQREYDSQIQAFRVEKKKAQEVINLAQKQVDEEQQVVLRERAQNRLNTNRLRSERLEVENKLALIQRDKQFVETKEKEIQAREEESKRNRTCSMMFIDDNYANLSPKGVVDYLTHSSRRIRNHAMKNVTFCINKSGEALVSFVQFDPADIAADLLPKLDQLISAPKPSDDVKQFAESIVSVREMAKAMAMSGQCPRLADYLVRNNEVVSQFAVSALRAMMATDGQVVRAVYMALRDVVPHAPIAGSPSAPCHPSLAYIAELSPRIIDDCFNTANWSTIHPLVLHKSDVIRRVALPRIVSQAASSDRVRRGLLKARTLCLLEHHYESPQPPDDIVDFFVGLVPHLAEMMCHDLDEVLWLISRLNDPDARINAAVATAFRTTSAKQDPAILDVFVKADLLQHLVHLYTQQTGAITGLLCHLLPILALTHARMKACSQIIAMLDSAEDDLVDACLSACMKIVDSNRENRDHLYREFAHLDLAKQSTLKLCDYAMPMFCRDWAQVGDFGSIAKYLLYAEPRVRAPVHHVWRDLITSTPDIRTIIAREGHLGVVFELANSSHDDCITLGSQLLPHMATEIAKAGPGPTRMLVRLLDHPVPELREATLQAIYIIAEGGDANCEVLLASDTFNALKLVFEKHDAPHGLQTLQRILVRLAPHLARSYEGCCGLLHLLDSKAESATHTALERISQTTVTHREILRNTIIASLQLASETLVKYSAQAINEWIAPDLVGLGQFEKLFQLASHHDRRIQNGALVALKEKMHIREYQESLIKAEVVLLIRSLSESDNPEAISFVAFALKSLAPTLARYGHVTEVLHYLAHEEPDIQDGASATIISIANGCENEMKQLLDANVLERLVGSHDHLGTVELRLTCAIIPPLASCYVLAKRVKFILNLADHRQESIRVAAAKSINAIARGTEAERKNLQDALLPLLSVSSAHLCSVASECLGSTLVRDLLAQGNYKQVFDLLGHEDPGIRAPVISHLDRYIRGASRATCERLVDGGILAATLRACRRTEGDVVTLIADCVLPILGPSFTQDDGGSSVIPLLKHEEPRIRAAAVIAIRMAVDSLHGSLSNIANARILSHLQATMEDEAIRDLWCYILSKIAPFLSNRCEIDVIIDSLSDSNPPVQQAASDAINVMVKTSSQSRRSLLLALIPHLNGPPPAAVDMFASAVSRSGSEFIATGNEVLLLRTIEHDAPALVIAAIEAAIDLLSNGTSFDREKLVKAGVFDVAVERYESGLYKTHSLRLLDCVVKHSSQAIIDNDGSVEKLILLFDIGDHALSQTLYTNLIDVSTKPGFLSALPTLFDRNRQSKPYVARFIAAIAPGVVPRLLELKAADKIMQLLMAESGIARAYLDQICDVLRDGTSQDKDMLAGEPQFLPILENFLKSRDVTVRRQCCQLVRLLSHQSVPRSAKLIEGGIGDPLAWIVMHGGNDVLSGLKALSSLYSAAPQQAEQLVEDSLPAIGYILSDDHVEDDVYEGAFKFFEQITNRSPHSLIIRSGVIPYLIQYLSTSHVFEPQCRECIFRVCQTIAQKSDLGRAALIDGNVLPVLLELAVSTTGKNLIAACNMLNALAHSGTYTSNLLSAGVKNAMERITSPFKKSTLTLKEEKTLAQQAAKQVLTSLKQKKHVKHLTRSANHSAAYVSTESLPKPMNSRRGGMHEGPLDRSRDDVDDVEFGGFNKRARGSAVNLDEYSRNDLRDRGFRSDNYGRSASEHNLAMGHRDTGRLVPATVRHRSSRVGRSESSIPPVPAIPTRYSRDEPMKPAPRSGFGVDEDDDNPRRSPVAQRTDSTKGDRRNLYSSSASSPKQDRNVAPLHGLDDDIVIKPSESLERTSPSSPGSGHHRDSGPGGSRHSSHGTDAEHQRKPTVKWQEKYHHQSPSTSSQDIEPGLGDFDRADELERLPSYRTNPDARRAGKRSATLADYY